jgi:hypothetical protein
MGEAMREGSSAFTHHNANSPLVAGRRIALHRPDLALDSLAAPRARAPVHQDLDPVVRYRAGRCAGPRARASNIPPGPWPGLISVGGVHRPPNPTLQPTESVPRLVENQVMPPMMRPTPRRTS